MSVFVTTVIGLIMGSVANASTPIATPVKVQCGMAGQIFDGILTMSQNLSNWNHAQPSKYRCVFSASGTLVFDSKTYELSFSTLELYTKDECKTFEWSGYARAADGAAINQETGYETGARISFDESTGNYKSFKVGSCYLKPRP